MDSRAPPPFPMRAHRFAVGGGGEAGVAAALPPLLAADVGGLAGHGGAPRRPEAAAGRAEFARRNAEQNAEERDVLSQRYPARREITTPLRRGGGLDRGPRKVEGRLILLNRC